MIRDFDRFRPNNTSIREHGEDVGLQAAMRADAVLEKGDLAVC